MIETTEHIKLRYNVSMLPHELQLLLHKPAIFNVIEGEYVVSNPVRVEDNFALFVGQQPLIHALFELKSLPSSIESIEDASPVFTRQDIIVKEAYIFPIWVKELLNRAM